jgi:hypothetical protein
VATDEAITPISVAEKRWDTTNPLVWSKKINNSDSNVTTSALADSYAHAATAAASV